MNHPVHYWHAPEIPLGTPVTASVVVKSDCGLRIDLPVWGVRHWEDRQNSEPTPDNACPACVTVQIAAAMNRHPAGKGVSTDKQVTA